MMRYLSPEEVITLHALVINQSGGATGVRDRDHDRSIVSELMTRT